EHYLVLRLAVGSELRVDTPDRRPGRLRTRRGDGHLAADDPVHERRLADVRPSHDGDETRLHPSPSSAGTAVTLTSATRRPCIRVTSSRAESTTKDSASSGTRSARPRIRPPTVSQSPSGSSVCRSLASSSTGRR